VTVSGIVYIFSEFSSNLRTWSGWYIRCRQSLIYNQWEQEDKTSRIISCNNTSAGDPEENEKINPTQ
jgi:hypothetical protein